MTVAEALPLIRARMRATPTCVSPTDDSPRPLQTQRGEEEEKLPETTKLIALKGQVLTWELTLQNQGADQDLELCIRPCGRSRKAHACSTFVSLTANLVDVMLPSIGTVIFLRLDSVYRPTPARRVECQRDMQCGKLTRRSP